MTDSRAADLFRRIRERRVMEWTLAYVAGAWIAVEATQSFSAMFGWSERIAPYLTIVLAFGVLSTITLAWFHGEAGWQRVTAGEVTIHGVIAASLGLTLVFNPPSPPGEPGVAGTLPVTRVAVLYYKDHSPDQELRPLASDLTEAVVHRLTQVPGLEVLPLTAVEPFRGAPTAYDSIVEALRAGSLVEGSVTRQGDEVMVTTQLFDSETQAHRGSWQHVGPDSLPSALVANVADSVARAIRTTIGQEVRERRVETSSDVPGAVDLYRRAKAILANEAGATWWADPERGVELLDEADSLLAGAERLDPDWIEPILLRMEAAEIEAQLRGGAGTMDSTVLRSAIDHATRALQLVQDSAPLLERRGILRATLADHADPEPANRLRTEAEQDLRTASRSDPRRPRTWWGLSQILAHQGNLEGAYQYAERAYETDSFMELTSSVLERLCLAALNLERIEEARDWCREGRRLLPDDQGFAMRTLLILASLPEPGPEDVRAAWAYVDTVAATGMPGRRMEWRGWGEMLVAVTLATAGREDSALAVIERAEGKLNRYAGPGMQAAGALYEAAALLRLGRYDAVFSALEDYAEQYPARVERLRHDWWFQEIWDDPRFIRLYGGTPTEALDRD